MGTKDDSRPHGARWGFRTPSPDFARRAVSPISPPQPHPAAILSNGTSYSYYTPSPFIPMHHTRGMASRLFQNTQQTAPSSSRDGEAQSHASNQYNPYNREWPQQQHEQPRLPQNYIPHDGGDALDILASVAVAVRENNQEKEAARSKLRSPAPVRVLPAPTPFTTEYNPSYYGYSAPPEIGPALPPKTELLPNTTEQYPAPTVAYPSTDSNLSSQPPNPIGNGTPRPTTPHTSPALQKPVDSPSITPKPSPEISQRDPEGVVSAEETKQRSQETSTPSGPVIAEALPLPQPTSGVLREVNTPPVKKEEQSSHIPQPIEASQDTYEAILPNSQTDELVAVPVLGGKDVATFPASEPNQTVAAPSIKVNSNPEIVAISPGTDKHPWINNSPLDACRSTPDDLEDIQENTITVRRPENYAQHSHNTLSVPAPVIDVEESVHGTIQNYDKPDERTASLPTPTQEDHVIQDTVNLLDAIKVQADDSGGHDIAKLTPEAGDNMDIDSPEDSETAQEEVFLTSRAVLEEHPQKTIVDSLGDPVDNTVTNNQNIVNIELAERRTVDISIPDAVESHNDYEFENQGNKILPTLGEVSVDKEPSDAQAPNDTIELAAPLSLTRPQPEDNEEGCQTCGVPYSQDDGYKGSWIGCDGCKKWHHARCVELDQIQVNKIDKFYCQLLKRMSNRAHIAIDYNALHNGSTVPLRNPEDARIHPYINKIRDSTWNFSPEKFPRLKPEAATTENIDNMLGGWSEPFIVPAQDNLTPWHRINDSTDISAVSTDQSTEDEDAMMKDVFTTTPDTELFIPTPPSVPEDGTRKLDGSHISPKLRRTSVDEHREREGADALDMIIPAGLTVRKVGEMIGMTRPVEVIEVLSQTSTKDEKWTMENLVNYFESPVREKIYNCISCEVSDTSLGKQISRPKLVRESDLVDRVWRDHHQLRKPTVGKYVLMSVKDSFTDFHIDFAGSSVFYHVYEGEKIFLVIRPTEKTLKAYEEWSKNPEMNSIWFPSLVPEAACSIMKLKKGDTLFIPSGWIHAVHTPVDTLVIGGNFLTKNQYAKQFKVYHIEVATGVKLSQRYPRFSTLMWHCLWDYCQNDPIPKQVDDALQKGHIVKRKNKFKPQKKARTYTTQELEGLPDLLKYLHRHTMIVLGHITTQNSPGSPKISQKSIDSIRRAMPEPINKDPLRYIKAFARWCTWKRACANIVPDGEKIPDWAHDDQLLPDLPGVVAQSASKKKYKQAEDEARKNEQPRRTGLRDRSKNSISPEEDPPLFPPPKTPAKPRKRRPETELKKVKVPPPFTERLVSASEYKPVETLMFQLEDGERITLHDGCIYVKKNSNLGPPRAGCQNCRQKKTGCKHKDEIAEILKGTWTDPSKKHEAAEEEDADKGGDDQEKLAMEEESVVNEVFAEEPEKDEYAIASDSEEEEYIPLSKRRRTSSVLMHRKSSTPVANGTSSTSGPPIGYKGRKPSCNDCKALKKKCLHQDTWKLVQDKQVALKNKKAAKQHQKAHRREAKEARRKASIQRQSELGMVINQPTQSSAVASLVEVVIMKHPQSSSPKKETAAEYPDELDLGLDTSILNEAPAYQSRVHTKTPEDPSIMAPPMDFDLPATPPRPTTKANGTNGTPAGGRTAMAQEQVEYLHHHRKPKDKKTKFVYTSSTKSIKRKAEAESPEASTAKKPCTPPPPVALSPPTPVAIEEDSEEFRMAARQAALGLRSTRRRS
ncbi:hypothetical protein EDC01DRAFT_630454 [Geopyxis carbonaria]|nr:hypothetical protein EDC01DRAFT_630454 [Geopyxis carbonaria]